MFLATTGLIELWDTKDRIVALGPWCTRHENRAQWEKLSIEYAANPWDDRERLHAAATYCDELCDLVLAHLTVGLNEIHGTTWSNRYWRVILGHWLVRYIHSFYDRYVHLMDTIAAYPNLHTQCLDADSYQIPHDTLDFAHIYTRDFFNLQLYSQILQAIPKPPLLILRKLQSPRSAATKARNLSARSIAFNLLKRAASRRQIEVLFCELGLAWTDIYQLIRRFNSAASLLFPDDWPRRQRWEPNYAARKALSESDTGDEFLRILIGSLAYNCPKVFVEGYAGLRRHVLTKYKQLPRVVLSATGWFFDESFKLLAAEAAEKGGTLLAFQHGGGYYLWRRGPQTMELKTVDRWFAWGHASWLPEAGTLTNPRFNKLDRKNYWTHSAPKKGILVVGNEHFLYPYWLLSIPLGSQYVEYIQWRILFIKGLTEPVRKHVLVRLYPEYHGWSQAARMRESLPDIRLDDHTKSFMKRLRNTKLAVFDHPTTSFIEALVFNVPTILFWNFKHWEPHSGASSCLKALQAAHVLHDNPQSASAKASEVYENPESWWKAAPVQTARRKFMDEFACVRPNWVDEWRTVIQQFR